LRAGGDEAQAYAVILPGFLGLVLGARLGHVLFYNFDHLRSDPLWLFRVWEGGLTSHGAAAGLALAMWWYSRRQRLPFLACSDRLVFSAALGAALVRLGNFLNSEIVGKVSGAWWAVRFPLYDGLPAALAPPRLPTQLLEFALGLLVLAILLVCDRRLGGAGRPRGALTAIFLAAYFAGRFLVEFLKERHGLSDDWILSRGQLLSIPGLAAGLWLLWRSLRSPGGAHGPPEAAKGLAPPAARRGRQRKAGGRPKRR
jgi:prolipoprotein diacylglyceryl transferase